MKPHTDEEEPNPITARLLEDVRSGNDEAADELVRRLYPLVWASVRRHIRTVDDHDDVAQVIYMKIFLKLHQFKGVQPFEHWASRICVTTCYDWLRKIRARPETPHADLSEHEIRLIESSLCGAAPADHAITQDVMSGVLDKLIDGLNAREQIAIRLLDLEETSVKEAARLTGWSESKVKTTAMRARSKLAERLAAIERRAANSPIQAPASIPTPTPIYNR